MSERHNDIDDDEIRIISSNGAVNGRGKGHRGLALWLGIAAVLLIVALAVFFLAAGDEAEDACAPSAIEETMPEVPAMENNDTFRPRPHAVLRDTMVNGIELALFCPENAVPSLEIGPDVLSDTTIAMAFQAADIRRDNGEIAGAFVVAGELRAKGEAKAGFCSIINGETTLGVADATPKLEEALMSDGYFFRQYPLVVGGQIVENRPKGRAVRKALAELDGRIYVIVSRERISFHDFSQALVDLGVRNAIYLVGADSAGLYRNAEGKVFTFGMNSAPLPENINFIVWR